jgi:hypothetical protein
MAQWPTVNEHHWPAFSLVLVKQFDINKTDLAIAKEERLKFCCREIEPWG